MPTPPSDRSSRLAAYSYLKALVAGRRVLEVGCGDGWGTEHLLTLGARGIVAVDTDSRRVDEARRRVRRPEITFATLSSSTTLEGLGPVDVVIVADASILLRARGPLDLNAARALLSPAGFLVCLTKNGDRPGERDGVPFYDLHDALAPHFPRVRMFGQTPFAAYGLAEFDADVQGLRVDADLVAEEAEEPIGYIAVAGPDAPVEFGYALVQIPGGAAAPVPAAQPSADVTSADSAELRRRLVDAEGRAEGAVRAARAQTEEIEELRARLRRAAEDRAALDEEMTRLRRALAEADESVLNLTRRTTEEISMLAQQLTSGLRTRDGGETSSAAATELRRREAELAARESALSDRDERIAALEAERQDLTWRLESLEEDLRRARAHVSELERAPRAAAVDGEVRAAQRARDQALEEYRRAAAAHVDEVTRLRDALGEQSTLVAELEDAQRAADERLQALSQELDQARRHAAEVEESDRQRRSRLAELEGMLIRLRAQANAQATAQPTSGADPEELRRATARVRELERETEELRRRTHELEREAVELRERAERLDHARTEAESHAHEAAERLRTVEALREEVARGRAELDRERAALAERFVEMARADRGGGTIAEGDRGRLAAAEAEVARLRTALERSEEQLWEAKRQLLLDRERIGALEHELEEARVRSKLAPEPSPSEATYQALVSRVLEELGVLESGLRTEAQQLAALERTLGEWRVHADRGASVEMPPSEKS
jgi:SAM-dependent methyltransferase